MLLSHLSSQHLRQNLACHWFTRLFCNGDVMAEFPWADEAQVRIFSPRPIALSELQWIEIMGIAWYKVPAPLKHSKARDFYLTWEIPSLKKLFKLQHKPGAPASSRVNVTRVNDQHGIATDCWSHRSKTSSYSPPFGVFLLLRDLFLGEALAFGFLLEGLSPPDPEARLGAVEAGADVDFIPLRSKRWWRKVGIRTVKHRQYNVQLESEKYWAYSWKTDHVKTRFFPRINNEFMLTSSLVHATKSSWIFVFFNLKSKDSINI